MKILPGDKVMWTSCGDYRCSCVLAPARFWYYDIPLRAVTHVSAPNEEVMWLLEDARISEPKDFHVDDEFTSGQDTVTLWERHLKKA